VPLWERTDTLRIVQAPTEFKMAGGQGSSIHTRGAAPRRSLASFREPESVSPKNSNSGRDGVAFSSARRRSLPVMTPAVRARAERRPIPGDG
jgi:hypothetical protein